MKAYLDSAVSTALRMRWISVQCYEIVLPNGKVIVTDPFFWDGNNVEDPEKLSSEDKGLYKVYKQDGFSIDQITGADYIIISHIHGDHINMVGKLWEKSMEEFLSQQVQHKRVWK